MLPRLDGILRRAGIGSPWSLASDVFSSSVSGMILALESSCDESAVALFSPQSGIVGEWVHSQIEKHRAYGGVVPEVASREHLQNFPFLLREALTVLDGRLPTQLAVTRGPGLAGCLALGVSAARALAAAWGLPVVGVNHLRGHAWSVFIDTHAADPLRFSKGLDLLLPHLGLLVSGGNTILFEMDKNRAIHVLAETVDDAAGEALDKGAKLLGMTYPGGPLLEKAAAGGDPHRFEFPKAFIHERTRRFSFSGLKTSLRYRLENLSDDELGIELPHICASYQQAVVDALCIKTRQVIQEGRYKSLGLSGGVANNKLLRSGFTELASQFRLPLLAAKPRHTGDNAAMISFAAWADPAVALQKSLCFMPSLRLDQA